MKFRVVLIESEEGFAVGCPALPGCWSQGATRAEALENIREAIQEMLEVQNEMNTAATLAELRAEGLAPEVEDVNVSAPVHA